MASDGPIFTYAILGAGLIVPDCYFPVARKHAKEWKLAAIWSRSDATIQGILPRIHEFSPETKGCAGEEGLEAILKDSSVDGVLIALPAQAQLEVAKRSLAAGKHVLQEKPIGANLGEAVETLELYHKQYSPKLFYGLAENYRSEDVFLKAREVVKGIGKVIKFDLVADMPMGPANKYFASVWRRDTHGFPGGFIADSGVHYIAALRTIAQAAGVGEVVSASARCLSASPDLPPPDTLVGHVVFSSGEAAAISFSFSAAQVRFSLSVVGTRGSLEVQRGGWGIGRGEYYLCYKREGLDDEPVRQGFKFSGFENEIAAFVDVARAADKGQSPDEDAAYRVSSVEGARDQSVVDAMMRSSAAGGAVTEVIKI